MAHSGVCGGGKGYALSDVEKVFVNFKHVSHYSHKPQRILLEFYVNDQHKVVCDKEVEEKTHLS